MTTDLPRVVLVADDELPLRLLIQASLVGGVDRIVEAPDGNAAWAVLQREAVSVAILDVQMPGRSGLDLTRAIRADPRLAQLPVILLTSRSDPSDVEAGLAAGATLYLTKPFSPLELRAALDRIARAA